MNIDTPAIQAAYASVRAESSPENWLLLSYASPTSDALTLTATGSGGLEELKTHLLDDQAQYAYLRVEYANDSESTRVKFALIIWIGERTRVMRKAKVGFQSGEVKKVLRHYSVQIDAGDRGDLVEGEVVVRCRKAGGADYNGGRG
ncbi:actin depolymerizing protein [Mytilinidion resinicola]|uniref:Actin depolymerizing protein n=1 Tax=Mytilinidion resinicola TaxID=574789 RepID=A0A6A6YYJ6_9PEZI|nr:actin depolymerizing protein [Mytilinidion resinicola]KAF2813569.1 actin depolymerizing protein [Mytilinidion resinicola]